MQNKYMKASIISSSIAILTGVLFFGISVTFGAPTYQPPGNDVSPTFNGVNVTGTLQNPNGTLSITSDLNLSKGLNIIGNIVNSSLGQLGGNSVTIGDDLTVSGWGNFKGALGVDTSLTVKGDSDVNGALNVGTDTTVGGNVNVSGGLVTDKNTTLGWGPGTIGGTTINLGNPGNNSTQLNAGGALSFTNNDFTKHLINELAFIKNVANFLQMTVTKGGATAELLLGNLPGVVQVTGALQGKTGILNLGKTKVTGDLATTGAITATGLTVNFPNGVSTGISNTGDFYTTNHATIEGQLFVGKGVNSMTTTDPLGISPGLAVTGDIETFANINVPSKGNIKAAGSITAVGNVIANALQIPSDNGQIINKANNPLLQTWWSALFGDYTALNSGYAWTGDATHPNEPVSVVAGNNGVFFTKGTNGTAYTTTLGKVDLNGHMTAAGGFGKVVKVSSNPIQVSNPAGTATASATCAAPLQLLSCSASLSGWGYINAIQPNDATATCTAWGKDTDLTSKLTVYALCLNPTL